MILYKMTYNKIKYLIFILTNVIGIFVNHEKVLSNDHYELSKSAEIIINSDSEQKQITIIITNDKLSAGRFWRVYLNLIEDHYLLQEGRIDSTLLVKSFEVNRNIKKGDILYLLTYNDKGIPLNVSYILIKNQKIPMMDLIDKYLGFILGIVFGVLSSIIINRFNERSREKLERRRESTRIDSSIKMAAMDLQDKWHSINRFYDLPPLIQGIGLDLILSSVEKYEEVFNEICDIRKIHKLWKDKNESQDDYDKLTVILDKVSLRFRS